MQRILIFANGELSDLDKALVFLRDADYIICADGGTRHALRLDVKPDLVIGDMDSTDKADLKSLQDGETLIELFPRDKNETDLELAIRRAVELDSKQIVIVAALGGRIDHTLANISLLADPRFASLDIRLDDGVEEIVCCWDQIELHGRNGDIVSLMPWGMPVHHIRTEGLKWMLSDETLYPEKTRGISNEMKSDTAKINIESGPLLVIHRRNS